MIVLDTNVLSELVKPAPDAAVFAWAAAQRRSELCATVISEAELADGLTRLPAGRRRDALGQAVARLLREGLGDRVLPFDRTAVGAYAAFVAQRRATGKPVSMADAQIAAIARARGARRLVTRNTPDFEGCGVVLVNPWETQAP
jgi:predicted nucleic acid-binding protein